MRAARCTPIILALLAASACTPGMEAPSSGPTAGLLDGTGFDHPTVLGMLRLANDPATDRALLMDGAGLDDGPADAIVRHRRGPDDQDGTWDDDPFDDGFELQHLTALDSDSLHRLAQAAHDLDLVPDLVVQGVGFTQAQLEAATFLANHGSMGELDGALDSRAVESVVLGRPYESILEVSERPRVGPAALEGLRELGDRWIDGASPAVEG